VKSAVRASAIVLLGVRFFVPASAGVAAPALALSMQDAIRRAIQTQLTTKLAQAATWEARGQAIQAAASLLPQVTGSVSQSRTFKANLAAQGFAASPFLPNTVIGPYNTFDARFELVQKILDLNSIWNMKAARANEAVARFEEDLAAEQVASAAALAYIENLRAVRNVEDADANLALAQRLSDTAHHQHDAGVATAVDVARAETAVSQNRQAFIQARLAVIQADIRLKRVVGLSMTEPTTLSAASDPTPASGPQETSALAQAQNDRMEMRIVQEAMKAETYALDAARANHLPSISASAHYGLSGNTPDSTARTGALGGQLELPIFSGGAIHGEVVSARGRLAAAQAQAADLRIQVEEDVRLALQTLSAEVEDVAAAETQVGLAERELKLAEDRYRAGVGDNIQVVTAQTSLADARKSRADARARYSDARANLAMALGHMRTFIL
jgi:outer membrane protein